jgi:uncharacterized protein YndB with AHSA1/START domain
MTRAVENIEHDGKPAKAVRASRVYDTDTQDLWDALTSKERIPRWFLPISGELKQGGTFQFEGNAGGTISECVPQKRIASTWEYGSAVSWLTITLTKEGSGTRLELEHVSLADDERIAEYGPGAVGVGWDGGFLGLAMHLASGEAMSPEAAMAWMQSDEGKNFYRACSQAWGEADIAAGTNEAQALEMARRTSAAYTGETPPEN